MVHFSSQRPDLPQHVEQEPQNPRSNLSEQKWSQSLSVWPLGLTGYSFIYDRVEFWQGTLSFTIHLSSFHACKIQGQFCWTKKTYIPFGTSSFLGLEAWNQRMFSSVLYINEVNWGIRETLQWNQTYNNEYSREIFIDVSCSMFTSCRESCDLILQN